MSSSIKDCFGTAKITGSLAHLQMAAPAPTFKMRILIHVMGSVSGGLPPAPRWWYFLHTL